MDDSRWWSGKWSRVESRAKEVRTRPVGTRKSKLGDEARLKADHDYIGL